MQKRKSMISCPSQETEDISRPVENVVLTTKGLQERNTQQAMGQKTFRGLLKMLY